jgi:two-component system sensor histidine kinase ChiS
MRNGRAWYIRCRDCLGSAVKGFREDLFLPVLLCIMVAIALNSLWGQPAAESEKTPDAQQGVIDLRGWDFAAKGNVPLNGQWEFYPDQLLEPRDFREKPLQSGYLSVPGAWNRPTAGDSETMNKWGFGTYRLIAKVKADASRYALRTNVVFMASRLFIDGQQLGQSGSPAASREEYQPGNVPYSAVIVSGEDGEVEIILQVANFDHHTGGIGVPLYWGYEPDMTHAILLDVGIQASSAAVLMMFGIFFLALFLFYIRDSTLLLFALFFVFFAGNLFVNGEKLFLQLFPQLPFEAAWTFKNFTIYIGAPLLYLITLKIHKTLKYRFVAAIPAWIVGAYCAAILLLPYRHYMLAEKVVIDVLMLFYLLLFVVLAVNYWQRNFGAWGKMGFRYYIVAVLFLLAFKVNNILYIRYFMPKSWFVPFAIICIILLVSLMLVQRYVGTYTLVAGLAGKLQTADRMKDEFLLRTSLELKTPIHRILNLSESMIGGVGRTDGREKSRDQLQMIRHTAFRMFDMVDDLVDLTKIRDGSLAVQLKAVDLAACAAMVFEVLGLIADGKHIRMERRIEPGAGFALADEQRLMQVFHHIIDNSLRYMETGGIAVCSHRDGEFVRVTVAIDGSGVLLDNREVLRQAFDNREKALELDSRGLGWSLSIADKLIGLMGGSFRIVWLEAGKGYSYEIVLLPHNADVGGSALHALQETASGINEVGMTDGKGTATVSSAYTVLVMESEAVGLEVFIHLLAMEGYRVTTASSGEEAMRRIRGVDKPDMVLLNMMMDGGEGYKASRAIRQMYSQIELPILFITPRNTPADVQAGLEAGGNDYITRPIDAAEVSAKIRTMLAMKRLALEAVANEMAFLQSQIKPHFLYNTLGAIMSLCYTDGRKAGKLIAVFSRYLRILFQLDHPDQMIALRKELDLIQAYTEIERERFGEKLHVQIEVDPALLDCRVIPLSIQPLVENAIRHGVVKKVAGGTVRLTIELEAEEIKVVVEDDGIGMSEQKAAELNSRTTTANGVGFASINKRIVHLTGRSLMLESQEGIGTKVTFRMPVIFPHYGESEGNGDDSSLLGR